jgi:hypothetical protein
MRYRDAVRQNLGRNQAAEGRGASRCRRLPDPSALPEGRLGRVGLELPCKCAAPVARGVHPGVHTRWCDCLVQTGYSLVHPSRRAFGAGWGHKLAVPDPEARGLKEWSIEERLSTTARARRGCPPLGSTSRSRSSSSRGSGERSDGAVRGVRRLSDGGRRLGEGSVAWASVLSLETLSGIKTTL